MKPRLAVTLAVAAATLFAASCASSSPTQSISSPRSATNATIAQLTVGDDAADPTLNPDKTADAVEYSTYGGLESLLKFNSAGQLEPSLAVSVTQPNPNTYVYHLRQGVKFWDGTQMTSADVVNALNYERAPGSEITSEFTGVKGVTAAGPYTVIVTLDQPSATWESVITEWAPIFEKKFQDEHPTTMGQPGVLIMGTGPFEIDSSHPRSPRGTSG